MAGEINFTLAKQKRWRFPFVTLAVLAVLLGAALALLGDRTSYEEAVVRAEMRHVGLGPQTEAALEQYPETAPAVFAAYGTNDRFQRALRQFGHNQVVPIIWKCLTEGDSYLDASYAFSLAAKTLVRAEMPAKPEALTPLECGSYAIELMLLAKNDFFGQYDIDEMGVARRLPGSSVAAFAKRMLTSGLQVVESRLVRGEKPTLREAGMAALDVAALGTFGLAGKASLAAKTATVAKVGLSAKVATAAHSVGSFAALVAPHVIAPVVKLGLFVGGVYLVVTQPQMVASAANTVLHAAGISPFVVYPLTLFVLFLLCWYIARRVRRIFA